MDGKIACAMLCLQSRSEFAPCAKPFSSHTTISDNDLRCLRRRDGIKISPFQGTGWRGRRAKQFYASSFYPLLKIASPALIIPKTPHSPLTAPEDSPPLPYFLSEFVAISETAAGHSARIRGAAVLALTAFLFGFLHSGIASRVPAGFARNAP